VPRAKQRVGFVLTERDDDILGLLDCHPLTACQLLVLSETFDRPFPQLRLVQRRMQRLARAGYVRSWPLATTGGSPHYFKLTRQAYRLLHGDDAPLPHRRHFEPMAPNRHMHTRALGDFLVKLHVATHRRGVLIERFAPENTLRLEADGIILFPDCAFQLRTLNGKTFNYAIELDNGTERIRSDKETDSLERKLRGYDRHQAQFHAYDPCRYVAVFVTTRSDQRLAGIMEAARRIMANPRRTVFLGTTLDAFLASNDPINESCFIDNRNCNRGLLP
jgi:hypothetical protein